MPTAGTCSFPAPRASITPGRILHRGRRASASLTGLWKTSRPCWRRRVPTSAIWRCILVYLRDPADGSIIEAALREKMGTVPFILVNAPVCRPGWLIEIEGIAVIPAHLPGLPEY